MSVIVVKDVGKAYKQYKNRFSRLAEWFLPGKKERHKKVWVLHDISFEAKQGEAIGIIGLNGAGKSTLLKIITGTIRPTTGSVVMHGRVAALLELGMGFHPEFTGRQNVYMSAQLLGFNNDEINVLMPGIESFAEIGEYIDQPVRVYSSGMAVRLSFSVATAVRPDVLIVDEALSVGDSYFQHKSFARIKKFKEQGTTLLLVSHDKAAIQAVCERAILLSLGGIAKEGEPEEVMDYYNALLADHQTQQIRQIASIGDKKRIESGTFEAEIADIVILNQKNECIEVVRVGEPIIIRVKVKINKDVDRLVFGFGIKDRLGQVVFGTNTFYTNQLVERPRAGENIVFDVSFVACLGVGNFSIQTALVNSENHIEKNYHWIDCAKVFEVINMDKPFFDGCAWNDVTFSIMRGHLL